MINGFAQAEAIEKKIWDFIQSHGYHDRYQLHSEVHLSLDATRYCEVFINMTERFVEPNEQQQARILHGIATEIGDNIGGYVPFFARGFEDDARIPNIMTPAFPSLNPGLYSAVLQRYLDSGIPNPFPDYNPDQPKPRGIAAAPC